MAGFNQDRSPTAELGSEGNQAIVKNRAIIAKGHANPMAQKNRKDADEWNVSNTALSLKDADETMGDPVRRLTPGIRPSREAASAWYFEGMAFQGIPLKVHSDP